MQVDLDGYERVCYSDVQKGDHLIVIKTVDDSHHAVEAEAGSLVSSIWCTPDGYPFLDKFNFSSSDQEVYRKKYELPQNFGAVVSAFLSYDYTVLFTRLSSNNWQSENGFRYNDTQLKNKFTGFKTLFEGVQS